MGAVENIIATLPHAHLLTAINLCVGKAATAQHQFTGRVAKHQEVSVFEFLLADGFEKTVIFKILSGVGATNDIGLPGRFFRTEIADLNFCLVSNQLMHLGVKVLHWLAIRACFSDDHSKNCSVATTIAIKIEILLGRCVGRVCCAGEFNLGRITNSDRLIGKTNRLP